MNITNDERRVIKYRVQVLDESGQPIAAIPHPDTWAGDRWHGRLLIAPEEACD